MHMRVAIILLLLSTSALGQMRGGARMGFGGHGVIVHRPGVVFNNGVRVVGGFGGFPINGGPFVPGVPASVTSLGPCGFTPCFRPFFRHGFRRFGVSPFIGNGFFGGGFVSAYPIAVPMYNDYATEPQLQVMVQQPTEPQRLEITIVDKRGENETQSNPAEAAPETPKRNHASDSRRKPAIFVFKDGWRKELANYAITGGQLIDVTNGKVFRVPLEKIDWRKTFEANARAGRKITLP
jgi:hypothetical protein